MFAENNTGQSTERHDGGTLLANSSLVYNINEALQEKTTDSPKKYSKTYVSTMGSGNQAPSDRKNEVVTCEFMFKLLQSTGLPLESCKHITQASYRNGSVRRMGTGIKAWQDFAGKEGISETDLSFENIPAVLQHMFSVEKCNYTMVLSTKHTLCEMKKLKGEKAAPVLPQKILACLL